MATQNQVIILSELDERFSTQPALVVAGGVATIASSTPTKSADAATAATGAVIPMVDADGTTSQRFTGIAKSDSNETASVNGNVTLWLPLAGLVYAAKAKTASTANTAALVQALQYKRVIFDLTAGLWTVDAAATGALTNCVTIIGGDYNTATLYFTYSSAGSALANITA